jgi:MscS family membrane protein
MVSNGIYHLIQIHTMSYLEFLQYSYYGNTVQQYLIAVGIFLLFLIGAVILNIIVQHLFRKYAIDTKTKLDDTVCHIFKRVMVFILALGGVYFGVRSLNMPENILNIIEKLIQVVLIFKVFQGITILSDFLVRMYIGKFMKIEKGFDIQLTKLITRILNIAFWVIGLSMILQVFGYNIAALVTGLGIGGLALALAAQDTLGNFFSSIAIMADKPYKIGDIIKFGDYEGFVRDIGLRTTRIETFAGTFISVPNSELAKTVVENVSKMKARKFNEQIGLVYHSKPAQIKKALAIIRGILKEEKDITKNFRAFFTHFDDSSLTIEFNYFVKNPEDYNHTQRVRTKINLAVLEKIEKEGIEMAFPTTTVHLQK